jgi:hypothetical protein
MLDYLTAGAAFWMAMFSIQEWLLEFRLGYLGRYWSLMSAVSLLIGFLLSALVIVPLIINLTVDPFTFPGNVTLSLIASVIFGVILSLGQWLILRQTEITPRVFALINTLLGILTYSLMICLNRNHLEWSGGPIQGWKTALVFLVTGAIAGGVTGKALDFYCGRVEQQLLQTEESDTEDWDLEDD